MVSVSDSTHSEQAEELLQQSEKKYQTLYESSHDAILIMTLDQKYLRANPAALKMFGFDDEKELISQSPGSLSPEYQPDGMLSSEKARQMDARALNEGSLFYEWKGKRRDGTEFYATILLTRFQLNGRDLLQVTVRDISEQKLAEQALIERQKELEVKTKDLEEMNAALNVLLKKRDEDKKTLQEGVLFNMKRMVEPYLEKLKESNLDRKQKLYVGILEENLRDIISTFPHAVSSTSLRLTPAELEVASLVKQGKSTKQIASALNISFRTAEFHRQNIRKKFNLKNRKDNLRTFLLSTFSS